MTMRYEAKRIDDGALRERMRALVHERRREGFTVNHKRLFRLYREERLKMRHRGGRKRAIGTRAPMTNPMRPNARWSLDFVSDQLTCGRRFRILTAWMTARGNASPWLRIHRCPACVSRGSWIVLSPSAAGRT